MPLETTTGESKPHAPSGTDGLEAGAAPSDRNTAAPGADLTQAFDRPATAGAGEQLHPASSAVRAAWPDQWREEVAAQYAGKSDRHGKPVGDRILAQLKRYASPVDAMLGGLAAQDKIRSGDYKSPLPEDATDEQKAEWRKANGIPEAPEGYEMPKLEDRQWSDEDKPVLSSFLAAAHEANLPQDSVNKLADWYARTVATATEAQRHVQSQRDKVDAKALEEHYRVEWGADFQAHKSLMERAIQDPALFPDELREALVQARFADGRRLVTHPAFPRFVANLALSHYGDGALISGEPRASVIGREDELVKIRNSDIDRYYRERNAKGQTLADELMEIRQNKANPRVTRGT